MKGGSKVGNINFKTALSVGTLLVLATACGNHEKPNVIYMPDMAYSPSIKAQEVDGKGRGMGIPVPGTIARNEYPYHGVSEDAAASLNNPLKRTRANLKRGQEMFNIYCKVCHGKFGEGDGSVVPRFPQPPTLQSDKIKNWKDGQIFHIMTMGRGLMPSYARQVDASDRWKIVHYVRVIQRAKNPTAQDLKRAEDF